MTDDLVGDQVTLDLQSRDLANAVAQAQHQADVRANAGPNDLAEFPSSDQVQDCGQSDGDETILSIKMSATGPGLVAQHLRLLDETDVTVEFSDLKINPDMLTRRSLEASASRVEEAWRSNNGEGEVPFSRVFDPNHHVVAVARENVFGPPGDVRRLDVLGVASYTTSRGFTELHAVEAVPDRHPWSGGRDAGVGATYRFLKQARDGVYGDVIARSPDAIAALKKFGGHDEGGVWRIAAEELPSMLRQIEEALNRGESDHPIPSPTASHTPAGPAGLVLDPRRLDWENIVGKIRSRHHRKIVKVMFDRLAELVGPDGLNGITLVDVRYPWRAVLRNDALAEYNVENHTITLHQGIFRKDFDYRTVQSLGLTVSTPNLSGPEAVITQAVGHHLTATYLRSPEQVRHALQGLASVVGSPLPDGQEGSVAKWMEENRAPLQHLVSRSGAMSPRDLYTEMWTIYVDDPTNCLPFIKHFGDAVVKQVRLGR